MQFVNQKQKKRTTSHSTKLVYKKTGAARFGIFAIVIELFNQQNIFIGSEYCAQGQALSLPVDRNVLLQILVTVLLVPLLTALSLNTKQCTLKATH